MYLNDCLLPAVVLLQVVFSTGVTSLNVYNMETVGSLLSVRDPTWGSWSSGILKSHTIAWYDSERSRTLVITSTMSSNKIVASIRRLDLRPRCADSLTLYDASGLPLAQSVKYCNVGHFKNSTFDTRESKVFFSASNKLGIRFDTAPGSTSGYGGFELTFTATSTTPCSYSEYRCANYRCIAEVLKCDTHNHCGDYSDNRYCWTDTSVKLTGRQIGIICTVIFLVIAVSAGLYIIVRRSHVNRRQATVIHPPPTVYPPQQPMYPPPYSEGHTNPIYK